MSKLTFTEWLFTTKHEEPVKSFALLHMYDKSWNINISSLQDLKDWLYLKHIRIQQRRAITTCDNYKEGVKTATDRGELFTEFVTELRSRIDSAEKSYKEKVFTATIVWNDYIRYLESNV